ncbi:MAG: CdaR family protein [Lachnospiraceae bacterium]|jgi:YbbR domain-containing protein|nr:CdaR family protein [Lachnospiraceae bacterium]
MQKRIPKIIRNNFGLKVISVLISIVIWYSVVRVDDPVITRSFTVSVTFTNQTYIQSGKQTYTVDDSYNTVIVYIKGNRSEVRRVEASDITVTADLTQIVSMDTTPVMVPLTVQCTGIDTANISMSRTAVPITIENIASKELPVTVDTDDTTPNKNFEVGKATANPSKVVVSGPESTINSIDSAVAEVDVTGMTQDGMVKGTVHLYDKSQNEISQETIDNEITFDTGSQDVTVTIDLWQKKSDISLDVQYSGQPKSGYQVSSISTVPDTITVVGDDDALSSLTNSGNKILIPEDYISVEGATDDVTQEIDLSQIITGNMRVAETASQTVTVTITILPENTKEVALDVDKIAINNLADNLTVTYDQTELTIRVKGTGTQLDKVTADSVGASVDLSGYAEGDYTVPVSVTLPGGASLSGDVNILLHIKQSAKTG